MNYPFTCPKCGFHEEISMKMSEYTASGHMCKDCNEEMKRDISSMKCGAFVDKTNTFYKRYTN